MVMARGPSPTRKLKDEASEWTRLNQPARAIRCLEEVARLDPDDPGPMLRLARLHRQLGARDAAADAFERAFRLYANGGHAVKALATLRLLAATRPEQNLSGLIEELQVATGDLPPPKRPATGDLPAIPLLRSLPTDALRELLDGTSLLRASPGETISAAGDPAHSIYIILEGAVRVTRPQRPTPSRVLREGDFFGELALLTNSRRMHDVIAEDSTVVCQIPRVTLARLCQDHGGVDALLRAMSGERLLENVRWIHPDWGAAFESAGIAPDAITYRTHEPGSVLLDPADPAPGLGLLLRGQAEVRNPDGTRAIAELETGDLFGELSLLSEDAGRHPVVATARCAIIELSREQAKAALAHSDALLADVRAEASRRNAHNALLESSPSTRVGELMTPIAATVDLETNVREAVSHLVDQPTSTVVVTWRGQPCGLIEAAEALWALQSAPEGCPAGMIMNPHLCTAPVDTPFTTAYLALYAAEQRTLVVTDEEGQAVGRLSEAQLGQRFARAYFVRHAPPQS